MPKETSDISLDRPSRASNDMAVESLVNFHVSLCAFLVLSSVVTSSKDLANVSVQKLLRTDEKILQIVMFLGQSLF